MVYAGIGDKSHFMELNKLKSLGQRFRFSSTRVQVGDFVLELLYRNVNEEKCVWKWKCSHS